MNVTPLRLFKTNSLYHIEMSCEEKGQDVTFEVFELLKTRAINHKPLKWYDIHPSLSMAYHKDKNTLEFREKKPHVRALETDLPIALCVDWNIIDDTECSLLSRFIHSLQILTESEHKFQRS